MDLGYLTSGQLRGFYAALKPQLELLVTFMNLGVCQHVVPCAFVPLHYFVLWVATGLLACLTSGDYRILFGLMQSVLSVVGLYDA